MGFNSSPQRLINVTESFTLAVMVYNNVRVQIYNVRVQITSAKGRDTWGKVQGNFKQTATTVISQLSHEQNYFFPAVMSDNMLGLTIGLEYYQSGKFT